MLNNLHRSFPDFLIDQLLNTKYYDNSKVSNLNSTYILMWISEGNDQCHHNVESETVGGMLTEKSSLCGHLFQTWDSERLPGEIIKCESLEVGEHGTCQKKIKRRTTDSKSMMYRLKEGSGEISLI